MSEEGVALLIAPIVVAILFIGMPWLFLHYTTKWKQAKTLTRDDESLLDDMHDTARRLEDRLITIERIMAAENPHWKQGAVSVRQGD